ncbi:hypothetical protein CN585_25250, partial [Bacillus toyonensis]
MFFFKRKKKKNKVVTQSHVKRNKESTNKGWLIHNTTSTAINASSDYGGSHSTSCSSHSSYDAGS